MIKLKLMRTGALVSVSQNINVVIFETLNTRIRLGGYPYWAVPLQSYSTLTYALKMKSQLHIGTFRNDVKHLEQKMGFELIVIDTYRDRVWLNHQT